MDINSSPNRSEKYPNKTRGKIGIFFFILFIYLCYIIGHIINNELYYYNNPRMLALPLIVGPALIYLFYRYIARKISKPPNYNIDGVFKQSSDNKDSYSNEETRRRLYEGSGSKYGLIKFAILFLYIFFATRVYEFVVDNDVFQNDYAVTLLYCSLIIVFYVIFGFFLRQYAQDKKKRHQEVYDWIKNNSNDSYGRNVVSTRDIAEYLNISEREAHSICVYHPLIHKTDNESGGMWTLYPDK